MELVHVDQLYPRWGAPKRQICPGCNSNVMLIYISWVASSLAASVSRTVVSSTTNATQLKIMLAPAKLSLTTTCNRPPRCCLDQDRTCLDEPAADQGAMAPKGPGKSCQAARLQSLQPSQTSYVCNSHKRCLLKASSCCCMADNNCILSYTPRSFGFRFCQTDQCMPLSQT